MNDAGVDGFFDQIDQWSTEIWRKHPWLKGLEGGIERNVFNAEKFYRHWLEFILPLMGISIGPWSRHAELKSLFHLIKNLNPNYFRSDEIRKIVNKITYLRPDQRETLTFKITGFFRLMGNTNWNPYQLESPEILEKWWDLFEEKDAWSGMDWLQKQDFRVPASLGGFIAWNRFHRGKLPIGDEHPRQWVETCAKPEGPEQAWKWDLKASIFAGEWSHADLQGVCGQFPQCENCLLLQTCNWSAQKNSFLDKNTIETRIQKGRWDTLKTEELTEWLLEDHDLQESWMNLEGVTEFRLKSIDHPKLLEWNRHHPGSKTPLRLKVLLELCRRYHEEPLRQGKQFHSSMDIFNHFQTRMGQLQQERFAIVILDNKHCFISEKTVTIGILNRSLVHPREVFADAIEQHAAALICIHNHPSGDSSPSEEDKRVTRRLKESGELLGIPLLDHVIIGKDSYTSFADEGWL